MTHLCNIHKKEFLQFYPEMSLRGKLILSDMLRVENALAAQHTQTIACSKYHECHYHHMNFMQAELRFSLSE